MSIKLGTWHKNCECCANASQIDHMMTTLVDLQNEAGKNSTRAFTARPSGRRHLFLRTWWTEFHRFHHSLLRLSFLSRNRLKLLCVCTLMNLSVVHTFSLWMNEEPNTESKMASVQSDESWSPSTNTSRLPGHAATEDVLLDRISTNNNHFMVEDRLLICCVDLWHCQSCLFEFQHGVWSDYLMFHVVKLQLSSVWVSSGLSDWFYNNWLYAKLMKC